MQNRGFLCRAIALVAIASLACQLSACLWIKESVRIYPDAESEPGESSIQPFREVSEGETVIVVLSDGSEFEAEYRGLDSDCPRFVELSWNLGGPVHLDSANDGACAIMNAEIAEIYADRPAIATTVLAGLSLAAIIFAFGVMGHGDGQE